MCVCVRACVGVVRVYVACVCYLAKNALSERFTTEEGIKREDNRVLAMFFLKNKIFIDKIHTKTTDAPRANRTGTRSEGKPCCLAIIMLPPIVPQITTERERERQTDGHTHA